VPNDEIGKKYFITWTSKKALGSISLAQRHNIQKEEKISRKKKARKRVNPLLISCMSTHASVPNQ